VAHPKPSIQPENIQMADIYEMHEKAFANVSAFVICKDGDRVATIAIKFPKDGAGRLYAYVHWLGVPMVRGQASGYGYDKRSAAVSDAVRKISAVKEMRQPELAGEFTAALIGDSGEYFDSRLRKAGFEVWQAV